MALPNPYVGPQPFALENTLFGRDREVTELRGLITSERIVLLHSPSGAGKSSLVNAGLIPQLRKRFDIWGPTRVNTEPPPGVSVANRFVWSVIAGVEKKDDFPDITLSAWAAKRGRNRNPLIIIDQFEEILRVDPQDGAKKLEFFTQLGEMLSVPGIWALLVLREDFLAPLDPYAHLVPTHLLNRYRLDRLTTEGAAEAISSPVADCPRQYGAGVVDQLVLNLARVKGQKPDGTPEELDGDYVEPLQLQVVCYDLWERMERDRPDDMLITADDIGDVSLALKNYYDNSVQEVAGKDESKERGIREWFQHKLITADGVRNQVRREPGSSGGLDNGTIGELGDTYLIRGEPRGGSIWYELSHDRLVKPVMGSNEEWLDAHLNKLQKSARLWVSQGKPRALLLVGADLETAKAEAAAMTLSPEESEFLERSGRREEAEQRDRDQAQREREQAVREKAQADRLRRNNIFLKALVGLSVIALCVAGWEWNAARSSSVIAGMAKSVAVSAAASALGEAAKEFAAQTDAKVRQLQAVAAEKTATDALAATDNAVTGLFIEKATSADLRSQNDSPEDSQRAWMYALDALDRAHGPVPDVSSVAGYLLWPDFYPGYRSTGNDTASTEAMDHAALVPSTGHLYLSKDIAGSTEPEGKRPSVLKCFRDCKIPASLSGQPGTVLNQVRIESIAVDSTEQKFAIGFQRFPSPERTENGIIFADDATSKRTWTYSGNDRITALSWSGGLLAAGTSSGHLLLFRSPSATANPEPFAELPCQLAVGCPIVRTLAWSKDPSPVLAAGFEDASIRFYRIAAGKPVLLRDGTFNTPAAGPVTSLAFWPGSSMIVAGYANGHVRVLDGKSGIVRADSLQHKLAVVAVGFSEKADTLTNVSMDGDIHRTPLFPEIFKPGPKSKEEKWDLKVLLSGESSHALRHKLLVRSGAELGYGDFGDEPVDETRLAMNDKAKQAAAKFFGTGSTRQTHFTKQEADDSELLSRGAIAAATYPSVVGDTIRLMPDQLGGARTAILHRQSLRGAFKVEFDYNLRSLGNSPSYFGDGFSFMFYKDPVPYEENSLKTPDFSFAPGSGYAVVFNSYVYRNPGIGLRFYGPGTSDDGHHEGTAVFPNVKPGDNPRHVCIEVSPFSTASMCPGASGPNFQGINVYIDGLLAISRAPTRPALDTTYGSFGFGGATGDAVEEQTISNVRITHAGTSAPDASLAFRSNNVITLARLGKEKLRTISLPAIPAFQNDRIILATDQRFGQNTAVLLDNDTRLPRDYAVDFEYSVRNSVSASPSATGQGVVFLFARDRLAYRSIISAYADLPKRGEVGSGLALHINTFDARLIQMVRNETGKADQLVGTAEGSADTYTNGEWRHVRVEVSRTENAVRVLFEGREVLYKKVDMTGLSDALGFAGSTNVVPGRLTAEQAVRNVVISDLNKRKQHD